MQMYAEAQCPTGCRGDLEANSSLTPAQHRVLAMASLQPGEFVLDTCCGAGALTLAAAKAVRPHGWVAAIDASDAVLNQARVEADERAIGNIGFLRMRPEDLHFRDGLFDAALSCLGLAGNAEPVAALREMRRVLRPGGRAVVGVWSGCNAAASTEVSLGDGNTLAAIFLVTGFRDVRVERLRVPASEGGSGSDAPRELVVAGGRKPASGT